MLRWALIFLVLGLIAAAFGFTGIAGASVGIAKVLFFLFLAIFAVMFILGLRYIAASEGLEPNLCETRKAAFLRRRPLRLRDQFAKTRPATTRTRKTTSTTPSAPLGP